GQPRMEVVVVQEQGSSLGWKAERPLFVGIVHDLAIDDLDAHDPHVRRMSFIDFVAVEFGIPFVAGTFAREQAELVTRASENGRGIRSDGAASIWSENVGDTRQ